MRAKDCRDASLGVFVDAEVSESLTVQLTTKVSACLALVGAGVLVEDTIDRAFIFMS